MPVMRTDDLTGGVWLPGDGKANPTDVTQALARGARAGGARSSRDARHRGRSQGRSRPRTVERPRRHRVRGGRDLRRAVVARVRPDVRRLDPAALGRAFYLVTERIEGVHPELPVMRDPDGYVYFKEEVGGLVMGGFEPDAKPWGMGGIPDDFEFQLLPDDHEQFEILMENALHRVPASRPRRSGRRQRP